MTANRACFLGLALALLGGPDSRAQDGEDALRFSQRQPAVGVRMLGMGGAGTGGLGDVSALFANPAGLGYLRQSEFSGSLSTFNTQDDGLYTLGGFSRGLSNDVSWTGLGHVGLAYRAPTRRGSMVIGASYSQVQTFSRELLFEGENGANSATDFFMPLSDEFTVIDEGDVLYLDSEGTRPLTFIAFETYAVDLDVAAYDNGDPVPFFPAVTTGTVEQIGRVTEEGYMGEFSIGGAVEAARDVMVGLAINVPHGRWEFSRALEEVDFRNDNDGQNGTVDFSDLTWTESIESRLVGVNVRGGLSAEASGGLRLGLTIESPTLYSISEDFATTMETAFDNNDVFSYGFAVDETVGAGTFDYEVRTPWRFATGVVYRMGDLILAADAEFIDWSQLELDSDTDPFFFAQANRDISQVLSQVVNTRFGAEYRLGDFAVRGGVALKPDPRDYPPDLEPAFPVDRDRTVWSAGVSYVRDREFAIDFGWSQETFDDQFIPYSLTGAPVVSEEVVRNRFGVGVRVFL